MTGAVPMRRQAVRSFAWAVVSFGGSRAAVFVMTLVLARILTPEDFGVVAAGMTVISYLELGLDLGVSSAVIYEQEDGVTDRVQTAFTLNLLAAAVFTLAFALVAPLVADFFDVDATALFRVLSLYLLLRGAGQINDTLLKRDLQFRKRAAVEVARGLVRMVVGIVLAVRGADAWALVLGLLAGEVAGLVTSFALVRFRPTFRLDRAAAKPMLRFGSAVLGLNVLSNLGENSDYLVVGNRLGAGALGLYTIAFRLPELLVSNVFWIFSNVAFPVYARARAGGDEMFRRAMLRALSLTTLYGFAVGTALALLSRDAIHVVFSEKWAAAAAPMALISLALGFGSLGYAAGDIFPATGRPGALLALNGPLTVVQIAGFILAAPHGMTAIAAVHLGVSVVYGAVHLTIANRLVGTSWRDDLSAMRPAFCVATGIVACGLPARLATSAGLGSLAVVAAACGAGAALGLLASGRSAIADLVAVARELRSTSGPDDDVVPVPASGPR